MKTFIIFIIWFLLSLLGFGSLQSQTRGLLFILTIAVIITTIIPNFLVYERKNGEMNRVSPHKRKYKEINGVKNDTYLRNITTWHITLTHPDDIGFLTKIDEKRSAYEYLAFLKKEHIDEKNN